MDYRDLAAGLLSQLPELHRARPQKDIDEALRGEAFVLHFIASRGGDVLPGEISHEMDVSSARVAAALNRLEDKGFITRRIAQNDRRKILVSVTEEGKAESETHQRAVLEIAAGMLSRLGEYDAREYVRITGKLVQIISKAEQEGYPCCNSTTS